LAQARQSFAGQELFPSIAEKAAAIGYYLCQGHCFNDGNKRTAYQTMFIFLYVNGFSLDATVDDAEAVILSIARREMSRDELAQWVNQRIIQLSKSP
jgi:death-on-curing protein